MERYQGYVSALQKNDLPVVQSRIFLPREDKPNRIEQYMVKLLEQDADLDAVFCFNDDVALKVCRAIKDAGRRVSRDIGVIGYDNLPADSSVTPKISSLSFKSIQIGERAAEILYQMIHFKKSRVDYLKYHLFKPTLVIRESCLGPEKRK